MFNKKSAFTLAELLIVIGIIGAVAALTIPNLSQSTNNKETVTKLKKVYANLSDAYGRARAKYGPSYAEWTLGMNDQNLITDKVALRIFENMNISKTCGRAANGCFKNAVITSLKGANMSNIETDAGMYKVVLADGTSVGISTAPTLMSIYVDVDGPRKGMNQGGTDIFLFYMHTGDDSSIKPSSTSINGNPNNVDATNWVITVGNMDYLTCTNLVYPTKITCK